MDDNAVVAVLSALIALSQMLKARYQNEHKWLTYRGTAESLKSEKFLFESQAGSLRGFGAI